MAVINSVKFGEVEIDKKIYYSDMIIWWTGDKEFRLKSDIFTMKEFLEIMKKNPRVIVIGTGFIGSMKIASDVKRVAASHKINIFVDSSERAAEIFNGFIKDKKHAVAIIRTTG